jgi:hypothetical protein
MSGESYRVVRILSPEELAKLEAERRVKEAEQRLEIEREITRAVLERLKSEQIKRDEETKRALTASQEQRREEDRLKELERDLLKSKVSNTESKEREHSPDKTTESARKKAEILFKLDSLELKVSTVEPGLYDLMKTDLVSVKTKLAEIKSNLSGRHEYFENAIKWHEIRVNEIILEGKKKLEQREKEHDALLKQVSDLVTDVEMLISTALLPDKGRVVQLKTKLESAISLKDTNHQKIAVEQLAPEIKALYLEYIALERLNHEREHILGSVTQMLIGMGYKTSQLPARKLDQGQEPIYTELDMPGGEGVRLGFHLDKGISAEVFHPKDKRITKEEFRKQERKWCSDLSELNSKLSKKGIVFEEIRTKDFKDGDIDRILGVSQEREDEIRRRMIQEQRKMQK